MLRPYILSWPLVVRASFSAMDNRCGWSTASAQMIAYHDTEWGVPVHNDTQLFLKLKDAGESFDQFLWQFVGGRPKVNAWKTLRGVPAETRESTAMSKALVERGFRFVGPTIVYAFMQAVGMVNDHLVTCYRYRELTT